MAVRKTHYSVELTYIDNNKQNHLIDPAKISSILIDYDYEHNNMPIILINVNIDKNILDDIINNAEKNSMIFALYCKEYKDGGSVPIKTEYIRKEFLYLIYEEPNKTSALDVTSTGGDTLYRSATLGLIDKECSNSRKKIINGVIEGNISSILYSFLGTRPLLMEPIPNNNNTKLIIPPMTSTTELVAYIDKVVPLYSTQYRLFYDFKRTYLLSSSGKCIPLKSTDKNSIHLNVTEVTSAVNKDQGMEEMENGKGYAIYLNEAECTTSPDKLSGKMFTAVAGVSSKGIKSIQDLNIDKDINSLNNIKLERVHHENLNKVNESKSNIELSSSLITINKTEIDGSVITLNNEYTIKHDTLESYNGKYLLARKREIFVVYDQPGEFICNINLSLRKIMS